MWKNIAILVFFALATLISANALPAASQEPQSRLQVMAQTSQACLRKNGFCVLDGACPADLWTTERGLCTEPGTDCCHGLPDSVTDCEERGGFCGDGSECGKAPRISIGSCPSGQECCVLI